MPKRGIQKVSVALVAYNRASQLPTTLDSILAQTFQDFELVVSDDCSTDDTRAVVEAYVRRDARVRYRRNERNLRMPGNLNAAIADTRGDFIAILHDGDIYRSDLLEKWFAALNRNPGAAFVFNQYESIDHRGRRHFFTSEVPECLDGREFLRRIFVRQWGSPVYGTVMLRRSCFEEVGPFDPKFSMSSDVEMWIRLAARYDVAYVAEPLMLLTEREPDHILSRHAWWGITFDVCMKRLAMGVIYPPSHRQHRKFELRARAHYLWQAVPALRHGRWVDLWMALYLALTGRDNVPPPY